MKKLHFSLLLLTLPFCLCLAQRIDTVFIEIGEKSHLEETEYYANDNVKVIRYKTKRAKETLSAMARADLFMRGKNPAPELGGAFYYVRDSLKSFYADGRLHTEERYGRGRLTKIYHYDATGEFAYIEERSRTAQVFKSQELQFAKQVYLVTGRIGDKANAVIPIINLSSDARQIGLTRSDNAASYKLQFAPEEAKDAIIPVTIPAEETQLGLSLVSHNQRTQDVITLKLRGYHLNDEDFTTSPKQQNVHDFTAHSELHLQLSGAEKELRIIGNDHDERQGIGRRMEVLNLKGYAKGIYQLEIRNLQNGNSRYCWISMGE